MIGAGLISAAAAFGACDKLDTCPEIEAELAELQEGQNGSFGRWDRLQARYGELGCFIESCNRRADEIVDFEGIGCMGEDSPLMCKLSDARELDRMREAFANAGCSTVVCPRLNDAITSQETHIGTTPIQSIGGLVIANDRLNALKERRETLGCPIVPEVTVDEGRSCEDICR